MSQPLVSLRGASFGYGRTTVVQDVDLEVRPGDFLGVAGPNGAGKTTVLRGIVGLLEPRAGQVQHANVPLGYVPQRDALDAAFPISVEEVVLLGASARLSGLRRVAPADRELALESLARVGLADRRRALFSSLSGGQRQRVLFARALVERPRLLVLDEPTRGIDLPTVEVLVGVLRELMEQEDVAVVFVSHEQELLRDAAREVLWVADGTARVMDADEALAPRRLDGIFHAPRANPEGEGA